MLTRRTPLKRTPFRRKPQQNRTITRGEREICTGKAWYERRKEVCERAGGVCECGCGRIAPLHAILDDYGEVRVRAGEAHHLKKRKMGGGFRDDRPENLQWLAWQCHEVAERPKKVVPKKPRAVKEGTI